MFLLSRPYLPDHAFSINDHRDCPFIFQNCPARFQQLQDADVDGVSDIFSMEIAHSPQIKHIALAVPTYPLSAFIPQDTRCAHLVVKQSRIYLLFLHSFSSSVLFLATSYLTLPLASSETFTLQFLVGAKPFSLLR